jgi:multiple antibiotic resistance protein
LLFIFIVVKATGWIESKIGQAGLLAMRKSFGVVLLAIAVKIFKSNL